MQRRPLNKIPFVLLATCCAVALGASAACSESPVSGGNTTGGTNAVAGTGGSPAAGTGGSGTPQGGSAVGGSSAMAGTGGTGTPVAGTGGTGTTGGTGGGGTETVACKAGIVGVNGSGLTVSATDISAFKYASNPGGNAMKMAYDPKGNVIVILYQDGKMSKVDPNVALPTTAMTSPVTTLSDYDSGGYAANGGYKDHRGIVFDKDGTMYVLASQGGDQVGVTIRKGVLMGAGPARTWTNLVTTTGGFPAGGTNFDHSFSGIAISPDGASLYFSSGSRSDHGEPEKGVGEVPLSSAVFKVPTATPTVLSNDAGALAPVLFADGTRNAFDMAFNAAGDLIGTDNGPDMDLPDEVNWLQQGKHYGFPFRFGSFDNPVAKEANYSATGDKRLHGGGYQAVDQNKYTADPTIVAPQGVTPVDPIMNMGPDANFFRADRNAEPTQAGATGLAGVTGHRSPLGIAFDVEGKSCGAYYKQGFMLSYGAVLGSALNDAGEDLLLLTLTKAGDKYTMTAKQIAKGIKTPMDSVLVGNKLFTVSFGGGTIYVFALPTP